MFYLSLYLLSRARPVRHIASRWFCWLRNSPHSCPWAWFASVNPTQKPELDRIVQARYNDIVDFALKR